jgi:hypothetical protein
VLLSEGHHPLAAQKLRIETAVSQASKGAKVWINGLFAEAYADQQECGTHC